MKLIRIETPWNDLEVEKRVDEAIASGSTRIKTSHMKIGPYNGFPGTLRALADWKIKVAIEQGLIPARDQCICSVCGSSGGKMDYHNEDYSRALQTAPICKKCHLTLHNRLRSPKCAENWALLVKSFGNGTKSFEFIDRLDVLSTPEHSRS